MSFERAIMVACLALASCGGFERGDPSAETDEDATGDGPSGAGDGAFASNVYPLLTTHCASCHGSGGVAAASAFRLSGDAAGDYAGTFALVSVGNPSGSVLLQRASGMSHGGGVVLATSSADYQTIASWITDGAPQ